jgi:hypothetical protein
MPDIPLLVLRLYLRKQFFHRNSVSLLKFANLPVKLLTNSENVLML